MNNFKKVIAFCTAITTLNLQMCFGSLQSFEMVRTFAESFETTEDNVLSSEIEFSVEGLEFSEETYAETKTETVPETDIQETTASETEMIINEIEPVILETSATYQDYNYSVSSNQVTITKYTGSDKEITIPAEIDGKPVVAIEQSAFKNNTAITSVTIPGSVTKIGYEAFRYCNALENITLSEGLTTIGQYTFGGTAIKSITIPSTVAKVDNFGAFLDSSLEEVVFADGTEIIPAYICRSAENLKKVTIPDSVKEIGSEAFCNCSLLTDVIIPDSVTTIGSGAFANCSSLADIIIPGNVTEIGYGAFSKCTSLTDIIIPGSVTKIGYEAFRYCNALENITLSEGLTAIGYYAFSDTAVKSITIPSTVAKVDNFGAFLDSSLEEVVFADGTEIIPAYICRSAENLKKITIPDSVKEIGAEAFCNCSLLTDVIIPDSVTTIGSGAFANCSSLADITIPGNVTEIGCGAFSKCTSLTDIIIPGSVTKIGYEAFRYCNALENITLSEGLTAIGYYAFSDTAVKSITIPSTVAKVDNFGAFLDSSLEEVVFADGTEIIPAYICRSAENLKKVTIPDSVKEIGSEAFYGCTSLNEIIASKNCTPFCNETAFEKCPLLNVENNPFTILESGTFTVNNTQTTVNGLLNYTVKYKFKENYKDLTDKKIRINIPDNMYYYSNSITSDIEIPAENIVVNDDYIEISVDAMEGTIRFSTKPTENKNYTINAEVRAVLNGKDIKANIGTIKVDVPVITINSPSETNSNKININGLAGVNEKVDIYADGDLIETVQANSKGRYNAEVTLPKNENGYVYTLCAVSNDVKSEEISVKYLEKAVNVTKLELTCNGRNHYDITNSLLYGEPVYISLFSSKYDYMFEIEISNSDLVDSVFVTSTKSSGMKYMQAFYDESKGKWIAVGYFDEKQKRYVPGDLGIKIIKKEDVTIEKIVGTNDITFNLDDADEKATENIFDFTLPEKLENNSKVEFQDVTENSYNANISLNDGTESADVYVHEETNSNIHNDIITNEKYDAKEIVNNYSNYGFSKVVNNGKTFYIKSDYHTSVSSDMADSLFHTNHNLLQGAIDVFSTNIIEEVAGNDGLDYLITQDLVTTAGMLLPGYSDFMGKLSETQYIMDYLHNINMRPDLQEMSTIILALQLLNTRSGDLVKLEYTLGGLKGGLIAWVAAMTYNELIKIITDYYNGLIEGKYSNFKDYLLHGLNWYIDPSGYVYEFIPSNRLEGVTAEIYFKETLESEEAVLWDAEPSGQKNPQITDDEGNYAWDVPEGYWQVVCTMDGYETTRSEWLPVPPPQLDVNLSMTSTKNPEVESIYAYNDEIVINFTSYMSDSQAEEFIKLENNGTEIEYTIQYNKEADNQTEFTKSISLMPTDVKFSEHENLNIVISAGFENYAEKTLSEDYSAECKIIDKIDSISIEKDEIYITPGEQKTIKVSVFPAEASAGKTLTITGNDSLSKDFTYTESVVIDESGNAEITVSSDTYSMTGLNISVDGYAVSDNISVISSLNIPESESSEENMLNKGDMDGDGETTSNDALKILQLVVGISELTDENKELADIDGDGDVTSADALYVLQMVVGLK